MPDGTNGRVIENGHGVLASVIRNVTLRTSVESGKGHSNGQYGYGRDYLLGSAPLAPVIERVHRRLSGFPYDGVVLDLGCGVGRFAEGANGSRDYPIVGIDLSSDAVIEYRRKIEEHSWPDEAHVGDITNLEAVDGRRIKAAVSWRVLHALPSELQQSALKEVRRVLPEGAPLFVAVASDQDWKAGELKARGKYKAIGQNECREVMSLAQSFKVEFFNGLKFIRLALASGFEVRETGIFTEPSGYQHLRDSKPDNTYLFAHLVRS